MDGEISQTNEGEAIKKAKHMLDVLDNEYPSLQLHHLVDLYEQKVSIVVYGVRDAKEANASVFVADSLESQQRFVRQLLVDSPPTAIRVLTWQEIFGKPDIL
jgi:hypothetical protein